MKKKKQSIAAFSLVEVCLALGVVVFCLVTILGLISVGLNSTQTSISQTTAANVLTAVVTDLRSTPNSSPKGTVATNSVIYGIQVPARSSGTTPTTAYAAIFIGDDGQTNSAASGSRYRLNVWTSSATATRQETLVRLMLTWPAQAAYTNAQGYVESVVALNRTP